MMMKHSTSDEGSYAPFLFLIYKTTWSKKHWQKSNAFLIIFSEPGAKAVQKVYFGKVFANTEYKEVDQ